MSQIPEKLIVFCKDHIELIYKGVPIVIAAYYALPILYSLWLWSPWLVSSYMVYNQVPDIFRNQLIELAIKSASGVYTLYKQNVIIGQ